MERIRVDPILQAHRPLVVAASTLLPLAACALMALVRDSVADTNAGLALVLIIVAAASTGIRWAGIAAALASAAGFDYFLTEPYGTFVITDRADIETAVLLLLVGSAVTEIALWGRRVQSRASREQGYLDGLVSTAATVAQGRVSNADLIDVVSQQITEVLRIDACTYETGARSGLPALDADGAVTRHGRSVDIARYGLPTDTQIALAAERGGVVYGHFLLTAATRVVRPTKDQLRVAVTLASQVGAALALAAKDTDTS